MNIENYRKACSIQDELADVGCMIGILENVSAITLWTGQSENGNLQRHDIPERDMEYIKKYIRSAYSAKEERLDKEFKSL